MNSHGDHSELWNYLEDLQNQVRDLNDRIGVLEGQAPEARQLQHEADLAAADLAESGYDDGLPSPVGTDRHGEGCQCPYCYDEPDLCDMPADDYDPGPECDDQGGMSEYRIIIDDSRALS